MTVESLKGKGISKRGWANVAAIMPRINAAATKRARLEKPNTDLASAENWLIREVLTEPCKEAIVEKLCAQDLSYPRGFADFPHAVIRSQLQAFI